MRKAKARKGLKHHMWMDGKNIFTSFQSPVQNVACPDCPNLSQSLVVISDTKIFLAKAEHLYFAEHY